MYIRTSLGYNSAYAFHFHHCLSPGMSLYPVAEVESASVHGHLMVLDRVLLWTLNGHLGSKGFNRVNKHRSTTSLMRKSLRIPKSSRAPAHTSKFPAIYGQLSCYKAVHNSTFNVPISFPEELFGRQAAEGLQNRVSNTHGQAASANVTSQMSLQCLPVETIEAILKHTTKHEQLALCTSSKLLYDLATRMLYRDLRFTCSSQLVQCFRVLKSKQGHALAVIELTIATDSDRQHLRAYFRLIKDVLARLGGLKYFHVDYHFETHSDILDNCVFPRLDILNLGRFEGRYTPKFLGRHSNITILHIFTPLPIHNDPTVGLPSLCFPNLKFYLGSTALFPSWLSGSTLLKALILIYECAHPMTNKTFEFLSNTPAERLHLLFSGWNLEGCRVVSKTLPALKAIKFINIKHIPEDHAVDAPQFIEHFSEFLPIFSRLEEISIVESTPSPLTPPLTPSMLDREHERVQGWRSTCPELKMCEFDAGVIWALKGNPEHPTWEPAARNVSMSSDVIHQWQHFSYGKRKYHQPDAKWRFLMGPSLSFYRTYPPTPELLGQFRFGMKLVVAYEFYDGTKVREVLPHCAGLPARKAWSTKDFAELVPCRYLLYLAYQYLNYITSIVCKSCEPPPPFMPNSNILRWDDKEPVPEGIQ
ncbi:hypothetical protein FIBSPDRAFT_991904 [Athelia psychrophila]|uniref:F-box domain-containing protein n=1 Tax=Athelia psychrophila TaxID=1759441 RepID=A0A166S583_9AGAM|nr:hypothetical protein FIBSPDRAFT_991904 [Fibularhizoctonia sp. CBS 109695]